MDNSSPLEPLWRDGQPLRLPPRPSRSSWRGTKAFVLLILMLAVAALVGGILSLLGPSPNPHFLPLWITRHQAPQLPVVPMAQRDLESLQAGRYFTILGEPEARQEGQ